MMFDIITKQEILQQISCFRESSAGQYFMPIPKTIIAATNPESAYFEIGRNASDCKFYYEGVAYREDLYDLLISLEVPHNEAYGIMERVRKGIGHRVDFNVLNIPQALKAWCLSVRYLPSRRMIVEALEERINNISDNDVAFRKALLDTLPKYRYTPMVFVGNIDVLDDIRKKVFDISKKKAFSVENETTFEVRTYDIDYCAVKLITIYKHNLNELPSSEEIYLSVCDMIENGVPIVALIEDDCYQTVIEERLKAILRWGVVCHIKDGVVE